MSLKTRLFFFILSLFFIFSGIVWVYSDLVIDRVNSTWAKKFIQKQVTFDKSRTLLPIVRELKLVEKMVKDPAIISMALNPTNKVAQELGLEALERYKLTFYDRSYFAAFEKSKQYFFNNSTNDYFGNQFRYTLSQKDPKDSWFFFTLSQNAPFQINVNKDNELGITKVWIDYLVSVNGQKLAVLGTGFDFTEFLENSVGVEQEGVKNFFFNKNLDIQLARDTKLIDYASMTKKDGQHKRMDIFFENQKELDALKNLIETLKKDEIKTLWATFEGQKQLLGLTYLEEIDWYSLTVISSNELTLIDKTSLVIILSILFLIALSVVGISLSQFILNPINELKLMMKRIVDGDYTTSPHIVGSAEIRELSMQFVNMVQYIQEKNASLEDIIKERTLDLKQSEEKLNTVLDSVEAYIYIKDTDLKYLYANKKVAQYFNISQEEIIGRKDEDFFDISTVQDVIAYDKEVFSKREKISREEINTLLFEKETRVFLSTKIPLFDEEGEVYALCGISTDITDRKKTEDLIKKLAFYDALTNLPNRRMLEDRLNISLAKSKRTLQYGAFLVVDLDSFKGINDKYGHQIGDELLIEVGKRITKSIRSVDTVARYGGDEFIVVLCELSADADIAKDVALQIGRKILDHLNSIYHFSKNQEEISFYATASIGITLFNQEDESIDKIFLRADKAMYNIKNSSKNSIDFLFKEEDKL